MLICFICVTSITNPSSTEARPAMPWPPARIAG
jgi:hypothetical protein